MKTLHFEDRTASQGLTRAGLALLLAALMVVITSSLG